MKIKILFCTLSAMAFLFFLVGCGDKGNNALYGAGNSNIAGNVEVGKTEWTDTLNPEAENDREDTMKISIGSKTLTATLADNSSVTALKELFRKGPLTIDMRDYGNMEKVGPIGESLKRNDMQITTTAGDIVMYQGNSLVIYYDRNNYNLTRIGKINNVTQTELKNILGNGNVTVTFSLD